MKRFLALDLGKKRTGLALVNDETKVATPLTVISKESHTPDFIKELINQIEEFEIEILIAGLPIDLKGNVGISAKDVQARMTSILNRVNKIRKEKNYPALTVVFIDERLSTAQAEKSLKMAEVTAKNRSNMRDAHAAMVIAQSYIDTL